MSWLALALTVLFGLSLWVGAAAMPVDALMSGAPEAWLILVESRLPRALALLLAGASMAIAGMLTQIVIRNRFVEPSNTGAVEAAGLGLLGMALIAPAAPVLAKMAVAAGFSLAATGVFLAILRHVRLQDAMMVPLVGMLLSGVISALVSFLAYRFDLMQATMAWTQGDLSGVLRGRYELLWLGALAAGLAWFAADRFAVAGLGRDQATALGLPYGAVVALGLAIVSMVTAVVVVSVGMIPFLGLIVPNLVRHYLGDHLRASLPWVALAGAGLTLACDLLGRVIRAPYEIPVGVVMGLLGSAAFIVLLVRGAKDER